MRSGVISRVLCLVAALASLFGLARNSAAAAPAHAPVAAVRTVDPGTIPPIEPGRRVVSIVAADIDGDGDLDVVATDGSLDLLVWVNDGAGHLTRKHASHSKSRGLDAPGPRLADRMSVTVVVTVTDPPAPRPPDCRLVIAFAARRFRVGGPFVFAGSAAASSRAPRAPPVFQS